MVLCADVQNWCAKLMVPEPGRVCQVFFRGLVQLVWFRRALVSPWPTPVLYHVSAGLSSVNWGKPGKTWANGGKRRQIRDDPARAAPELPRVLFRPFLEIVVDKVVVLWDNSFLNMKKPCLWDHKQTGDDAIPPNSQKDEISFSKPAWYQAVAGFFVLFYN